MTPDTAILIGQQTLLMAVPLLVAGLGELIVERSGSVNIGIEGMMLVGALAGWAAAAASGSAWAGAVAATAAGVAIAALFALVAVIFRGDQIVAGTAINLLAAGLTGVCYARWLESRLAGRPPVYFERFAIPVLRDLPVLGRWLFAETGVFYQHGLLYLAVLGIVGAHYYLYHTRWGIELRALGENPVVADAAGIRVHARRVGAILFGGACAGLAGAYLTLMLTHEFRENITAGGGFLALAMVIFGRWRPAGLLVAGLVFGMLRALAYQLGVGAWSLPIARQWPEMAPYLLSILLLALLSGRARPPAMLGRPYERPHD